MISIIIQDKDKQILAKILYNKAFFFLIHIIIIKLKKENGYYF